MNEAKNRYFEQEDQSRQDCFGFDLGDGESAVAWLDSQGAGSPLMLEIAGRKSLLTALGLRNGEVLIGEQACLAEVDQLHLRFKSRFLTDPEASGLVRQFAARVLEDIRRSGRLGPNSAFFIGCPSGWREAQRENYRRLFVEAGFPQPEVVSESRAAFLFARESGELPVSDDQLRQPALVIDAGSSTTDFTFIRELQAVEVADFGENRLGGGLIDQALLAKCISRHPQAQRVRQVLSQCPQYAARCELEARKVKEMYFTRLTQLEAGQWALPCESSVKLYYDNPPLRLDIGCDRTDMEDILSSPMTALGGLSYLAAYRRALESAKAALGGDSPLLILLTGGASRMDFMARAAKEVFPNARLVTGAEPEFSIARGLCYALRIDRRTRRFQRDVKALIDSDQVEDIVAGALPSLFATIAPVLAESLVQEAAPAAFRRWKRGELKTIDQMSQAMKEHLAQSLAQGLLKASLEKTTRSWLEGVRPQLEALTDPICARCHLPLTSLRLAPHAPVDAARLDIDAGSMVNLDLIQTVVDVAVAALVAALLGGGGIALLMAGPVGLAVSFVIGFVASRLGTSLARQHLGGFNMPLFMRSLFTERAFRRSLASREGEIAQSIHHQLRSLLEGPDPSVLDMHRQISDAIEAQLTSMAQRARLLIR